MSINNFIRSIKFFSILMFFILTGCAEKVTQQAFVNEFPPEISALPQASIKETTQIPVADTEPVLITKKQKAPSYNTVWDRLIDLYALPEYNNDRIEFELQQYLKHPRYLTKIQQRAEPYIYFILEQIEEKKIPGELALLPIVESAFKATAMSHSRASGLWQFMPATGRLFGLKQNSWYDGRNDIYTSTKAATTYLQQLSRSFNDDWLLALASYNAGKGNIRKAIRKNTKKNLATDFWSLSLPKETMKYVPRLLALAKIFADPEKYNLSLHPVPNSPFFTIVDIKSQLDLRAAAKMAETSHEQFFNLNPAFKRWSTDPEGPFHLLIETEKVDSFKQKLASLFKKDKKNWIRHKIKSGESLSIIAKKYNTNIEALRKSNQLANNHIRAGKTLLIPTLTYNTSFRIHGHKKIYTVKKGDTFWDIARQFSVSSKQLAHWNNLSLSKILRPGQKLIIRKG